MFTDFGQFLKIGGLPVYAMIGLAIFAFAIAFERIQALYFNYSVDPDVFLKHVKALILSDKMEEAIAYCTHQGKALLPKAIKMILERADRDDDSIHNAHDIASMEVVPLITKRLGYLAMVANVATLIGLLGTIHGLIESFQAVSFADPAQKQTLLAQGISLSMNTTAMGLAVAIPTMIVYAFLQARQNKLIEDIISVSARLVDVLLSRAYQGYSETSAYPTENGSLSAGVDHVPDAPTKGKRKVA
jgi:biopolymer transport protein ExbB